MNTRSKSDCVDRLLHISVLLVLIQFLAINLAECSLSTVIQPSKNDTTSVQGNKISRTRVSVPDVASKISELGPSLEINKRRLEFGFKPAQTRSLPSDNTALEVNEPTVNPDTLLQKLGGMMRNVIAPTKSYIDLVNRYHKWFNSYKALQKSSRRKLRDPNEVLKEEYAKVDEILLKEEAEKHAAEVAAERLDNGDLQGGENAPAELAKPMDPKRAENMDFVFRALRVVIERLEKNFHELEEREGIDIDEDLVSATEEDHGKNDERIKQAMERVKRTLTTSAKNLLSGEMVIIARSAFLNGLARFMESKPDTGDALDHLRPIIALLGSASTPLAVSYLMSLEYRAAMAVVNQANPLSFFGIDLKRKKSLPTLDAAA